MANVTLTFDVKDMFFDRKKVEDMLERNRRRVLGSAGAMVRKIARSSIKKAAWRPTGKKTRGRKPSGTIYVHEYLAKRTAISNPGDPPRYHSSSKEIGVRKILFAYDPARDTVIVGPVGTRGSNLEALEYGGTITTRIPRWAKSARRRFGKTHTKRIAARPFMRPALETFATEYPDMWRDALK